MAGNSVSGVGAISASKTAQKKSDYDKVLVGVSGGAISTIIGLFGVSQFQKKISLSAVRQEAVMTQRLERPIDKIPTSASPIHFNNKAAEEVSEFIHDPSFAKWAKEKGAATVKRHNEFLRNYNAQCFKWEKNTMRGYLKKALVGAKRARVKNNIAGAIYTGVALFAAVLTAKKCME